MSGPGARGAPDPHGDQPRDPFRDAPETPVFVHPFLSPDHDDDAFLVRLALLSLFALVAAAALGDSLGPRVAYPLVLGVAAVVGFVMLRGRAPAWFVRACAVAYLPGCVLALLVS